MMRRLFQEVEALQLRVSELENRVCPEKKELALYQRTAWDEVNRIEERVSSLEEELHTPVYLNSQTQEYFCPLATCQMVYARQDKFVEHIRGEDGHKTLQSLLDQQTCLQCDYKATSAVGLWQHDRVTHKEENLTRIHEFQDYLIPRKKRGLETSSDSSNVELKKRTCLERRDSHINYLPAPSIDDNQGPKLQSHSFDTNITQNSVTQPKQDFQPLNLYAPIDFQNMGDHPFPTSSSWNGNRVKLILPKSEPFGGFSSLDDGCEGDSTLVPHPDPFTGWATPLHDSGKGGSELILPNAESFDGFSSLDDGWFTGQAILPHNSGKGGSKLILPKSEPFGGFFSLDGQEGDSRLVSGLATPLHDSGKGGSELILPESESFDRWSG